jgi:hypothetical protein
MTNRLSPSYAPAWWGAAASADVVTPVVSGAAVHEASVTLTDAQIKQLVGTPVQIVGPPGPTRVIVPVMGWVFFDTRNGAYTNYDAWAVANPYMGAIQLIWLGSGHHAAGPAAMVNFGVGRGWGTLSTMSAIGGTDATGTYAAASTIFEAAYTTDAADILNVPLVVQLLNAAGELTGGNAANFMVWTVWYRILDVTTGVFS